MSKSPESHAALTAVVAALDTIAVAVSGGVDSLTLATFAHRLHGSRCVMFHAVSPAVPSEATLRTQELAAHEGWNLCIIDAGEFGSADYVRNPVNRCFYCKTTLYVAIRAHTSAQIVSGTNVDDLSDYRPGLTAAREHGVRHPFVEADMTKSAVRELARALRLGSVAELPASPCLASRVETGIAIDADVLADIQTAERYLSRILKPKTVRCRVRGHGVVIELDEYTLALMASDQQAALRVDLQALFASDAMTRPVTFERYRVGSAFLRAAAID